MFIYAVVHVHPVYVLTECSSQIWDLLSFMLIMLVFIIGYGITSQSILYPNAELHPMLIVDVLKKAYWQIFAELFLEEIEGWFQEIRWYRLVHVHSNVEITVLHRMVLLKKITKCATSEWRLPCALGDFTSVKHGSGCLAFKGRPITHVERPYCTPIKNHTAPHSQSQ